MVFGVDVDAFGKNVLVLEVLSQIAININRRCVPLRGPENLLFVYCSSVLNKIQHGLTWHISNENLDTFSFLAKRSSFKVTSVDNIVVLSATSEYRAFTISYQARQKNSSNINKPSSYNNS